MTPDAVLVISETRQSSPLGEWEPRILRGALLTALLAAPFAFGAVQTWAWASIGAIAAVLLICWAAGAAGRGRVRVAWSPLYIPALGMILLGAIQLLGGLTIDAESTRESLLSFSADVIIFFLAFQLWSAAPDGRPARHPTRALGPILAVYGFAISLFAILQWLSSGGRLYWRVKTTGWIFGPYVNHNHYAGLMEMLIPVTAAYALSRPKGQPGNALLAFLVLFPIASAPLSGSRGGCVALLAECLLLVAAIRWRASGAERRRVLLAGLLLLLAVGGVFAWLGSGAAAQRLASIEGLARSPEITLGRRLAVARDGLRILAAHPWAGTGLGTFAVAFPQFQTFASDLDYAHAHDDYVEAVAETGMAGGLLILAALVLFLRGALKNLLGRLTCQAGWIRFGAGVGCVGILIHSLADFNLHIPANAAWFAFLVGIALADCGPMRLAERLSGSCHPEPVRPSAANGPERSEGAQGRLREGPAFRCSVD